MSTRQTRKRKSDEMTTDEAVTPTGSPAPKRMKITERQKQALIDNLRLEITERARRLRAQYAVQCTDLRARIERRIHRVPTTMRNMTMADLMAKYEDTNKAAPVAAVVNQAAERQPQTAPKITQLSSQSPAKSQSRQPQPSRSRKRKTSDVHIASDKENNYESIVAPSEAMPTLKNNKRTKTTTATRPASRAQKARTSRGTTGVLSPRSHNSRTLPRSPIKDVKPPSSPSKLQQQQRYTSQIARPISPLKPSSPLKTAATAATSAISASMHTMLESARSKTTHASKPSRVTSKESNPPSLRAVSAQSNRSTTTALSTTSTTTVVTKPKRAAPSATSRSKKTTTTTATNTAEMPPPPPRTSSKRTAAATASKLASATVGALKKTASGSGVAASTYGKSGIEIPATGKRVLRKRG